MAILLPDSIARYAYEAGIRDKTDLITAVAIAMGESLGNTDAVGDVSLQDGKWGPSIGLWQIRSLKAESGKGTERDATRLKDPANNARAMYSISSGGKNWQPWTVYNAKIYLIHMPVATAGVTSFLAGKTVTDPVVGAVETAQNAKDMASAVPEALDATYGWVSNRSNWIRVAQVVLGTAVIVAGVAYIAKDQVPNVAGVVTKAVLKGK